MDSEPDTFRVLWQHSRMLLSARFWIFTIAVLAVSRLAGAADLPPPADRPVDFVHDIQPLFARHCLNCHGREKQKNDLRLDVKSVALRGGSSGRVIIPGKSGESLLVQYVSGEPEDKRMPAKGDPLSAGEIGLLRAWIDQGAHWPDGLDPKDFVEPGEHWSFTALKKPAPPRVRTQHWGRNDVDRFVLARLEKEGLQPNPEADRRTLIRRAYFSIVGLPPSPAEVEAFVRDNRPEAWEALVNRLLDSPHYGECWARHWLDVVRFAESNGFETNLRRANAWPYRDYVIRAFNRDLPYDRFVTEQLAGDTLGVDEATGFLVGGPWDAVKSPDIGLTTQQRMDELNDMISTTGTAFLGLTVGCARCHNHKFDPIPQKNYYQMQAIFAGVQHGERVWRKEGYAERMREAEMKRHDLAEVEKQLAGFVPLARSEPVITTVAPSPKYNEHRFADVLARAVRFTIFDTLGGAEPCIDELEVYDAAGRNVALASTGAQATASGTYSGSDFHKLKHINDGKLGNSHSWISNEPGKGWVQIAFSEPATINRLVWARDREEVYKDRLASAYTIEAQTPDGTWRVIAERPPLRAPVSPEQNVERFLPRDARYIRFTILETTGGEPCLDELEVYSAEDPSRNIALATFGTTAEASGTYPNSELHRLEHINDGRVGNSRSWISNESGKGWIQLNLPSIQKINRVVWGRDREKKFRDRLSTKYKIETAVSPGAWTLAASSDDREPYSSEAKPKLMWSAAGLDPEERARLDALVARKQVLDKEIKKLTSGDMIYAGRFEQPGPTYRLNRGEALQKAEQVNPGMIEGFGKPIELATDTPEAQRRTALARWIIDPANPLPARVMVNRIWQYNFGQGIVATPSDFGNMGAPPTHPELLDWLASEFIEHGWSIKHIQRLILLSATFRQSSEANPAGLKTDAGSRLLWRFPPRRLDAEPLRDTILTVSGQLDARMGGPGFDLFEPNGNYVKVYNPKTEFGPPEFRRMVYQEKPRMRLDDTFGVFDCPDAGQVAPRRNVSTTPLQALGLLHSPFILQQADLFAERLQAEAGSGLEAQVERAFTLAFNRAPAPAEEAAAVQLARHEGLPMLCRALFNANEFLYIF